MKSKLKMTQCIHSDSYHNDQGSPQPPLYDTSLFAFESTQAMRDVMEGKTPGAFYSRYGMNPTITALEGKLAQLDNAEASLAFSSGMAAISSLFMHFASQGILCVGDVYGGTQQLLSKQLPALGIKTFSLQKTDLKAVEALLQAEKPALVFIETPSNPTLQLQDIHRLAKLVHEYDALLAVDNTFATPVNQCPIALGADFTVQSATKYLGGHSDLTAGVLSGRIVQLEAINDWRKNLGQTISTEVAHKLSRSLLTLALRVERHNFNAQRVADYLDTHPKVHKTCYPGLKGDPQHDFIHQQMSGFGGMVSFYIKGDAAMAERFVDLLKVFAIAPSLGGVESLATQPIYTSHFGLSEEILKQADVDGSLIRLSVGLEDIKDLINDLEQAFSRCQ